jgi:hypothetical protein
MLGEAVAVAAAAAAEEAAAAGAAVAADDTRQRDCDAADQNLAAVAAVEAGCKEPSPLHR